MLNSETLNWCKIPIPGHVSREKLDLKGFMYPNVHCRTIYDLQING